MSAISAAASEYFTVQSSASKLQQAPPRSLIKIDDTMDVEEAQPTVEDTRHNKHYVTQHDYQSWLIKDDEDDEE